MSARYSAFHDDRCQAWRVLDFQTREPLPDVTYPDRWPTSRQAAKRMARMLNEQEEDDE